MFFLRSPNEATAQSFLRNQKEASLSYPEHGATRGPLPVPFHRYNVDHNRVLLGAGKQTYDRAVQAIQTWKMVDLGWCQVYPVWLLVLKRLLHPVSGGGEGTGSPLWVCLRHAERS